MTICFEDLENQCLYLITVVGCSNIKSYRLTSTASADTLELLLNAKLTPSLWSFSLYLHFDQQRSIRMHKKILTMCSLSNGQRYKFMKMDCNYFIN